MKSDTLGNSAAGPARAGMGAGRKAALFAAVACAWWALDRATKAAVDVAAPGTVLVDDVLGLFEFRLVHNTGAAWGIFDESTWALGVFSLVTCGLIVVYLFVFARDAGRVQTCALALVCAGGLGNAFDRFAQGYVTDFINCTFIEFPVFNVADIGVTCGVAVFFVALLAAGGGERRDAAGDGDGGARG